ncbi:MAG: hypothetical protein OEZ06_24380 [Myxococcales bacterium]|nr:hypothetical protein [Myxococcales bacterium]
MNRLILALLREAEDGTLRNSEAFVERVKATAKEVGLPDEILENVDAEMERVASDLNTVLNRRVKLPCGRTATCGEFALFGARWVELYDEDSGADDDCTSMATDREVESISAECGELYARALSRALPSDAHEWFSGVIEQVVGPRSKTVSVKDHEGTEHTVAIDANGLVRNPTDDSPEKVFLTDVIQYVRVWPLWDTYWNVMGQNGDLGAGGAYAGMTNALTQDLLRLARALPDGCKKVEGVRSWTEIEKLMKSRTRAVCKEMQRLYKAAGDEYASSFAPALCREAAIAVEVRLNALQPYLKKESLCAIQARNLLWKHFSLEGSWDVSPIFLDPRPQRVAPARAEYPRKWCIKVVEDHAPCCDEPQPVKPATGWPTSYLCFDNRTDCATHHEQAGMADESGETWSECAHLALSAEIASVTTYLQD